MRKLQDLSRREMYIIAKDYASTSQANSGSAFVENYKISLSTFYNVLHKCVLEKIVPESVAKQIATKAANNNYNHGGEGAKIRTLEMYEDLIVKSQTYRFNRADAKYWALKYIESELDLIRFADINYLDAMMLKRALHDAVVNGWIDDEAVEKLKEKTKKQKSEDVEGAFEKMLEKRVETSKKKKK